MTRAGFVDVSREAMEAFLKSHGFAEASRASSSEVVYERAHHKDPELKVRVWTSIARGRQVARECGADAIRVVVIRILDEVPVSRPIRGIAGPRSKGDRKLARIHRTGSVDKVFARLLVRMREAYAIANAESRFREERTARLLEDDPESHTGHIPRFSSGAP